MSGQVYVTRPISWMHHPRLTTIEASLPGRTLALLRATRAGAMLAALALLVS